MIHLTLLYGVIFLQAQEPSTLQFKVLLLERILNFQQKFLNCIFIVDVTFFSLLIMNLAW